MPLGSAIATYIASEEDAARCYKQLAAWADFAMRHRCQKYFSGRAKKHEQRVHDGAKYAVDQGVPVIYRALPSPSVEWDIPASEPPRDMLDWFQAALKLENGLLDRLSAIGIDAAKEGDLVTEDLVTTWARKTTRQIAHLRRKVVNLEEAAGDAAALQAFDRQLI